MSQICQCTLDWETVRFNRSLYCSQDSWSVYEGHVEGAFNGILMETDFMLTNICKVGRLAKEKKHYKSSPGLQIGDR